MLRPLAGSLYRSAPVACVSGLTVIPVSSNTERRVEALFAKSDCRRVIAHLLEECGDNLPMVDSSYHELAERIRFAVLKLSNGNFERLIEQTSEAAKDWRDTLMAAEFGEDTKALLAWEPESGSGS